MNLNKSAMNTSLILIDAPHKSQKALTVLNSF